MAERRLDGDTVLARLRELPGGPELLDARRRARATSSWSAGAVRDLLLGARPRELDVVVADEAPRSRGELALSLGARSREVSEHERFGTALVALAGRAGRHRDAARGVLPGAGRAARRCAQGRSRRTSRGATSRSTRSRSRSAEARRASLARAEHALEDLQRGAPARAARAELRRRSDAAAAPRSLPRAARLRDRAAHRRAGRRGRRRAARFEPSRARAWAPSCASRWPKSVRWRRSRRSTSSACSQRSILACASTAASPSARSRCCPQDGRPDLLLLAALACRSCCAPGTTPAVSCERCSIGWSSRPATATAWCAPRWPGVSLVEGLRDADSPAELHAVAGWRSTRGGRAGRSPGEPGERAAAGSEEVRHVRLRIDGADLLAAGIPEGPDIGRRLEEVLRARLDERLPDEREAQLRAALDQL